LDFPSNRRRASSAARDICRWTVGSFVHPPHSGFAGFHVQCGCFYTRDRVSDNIFNREFSRSSYGRILSGTRVCSRSPAHGTSWINKKNEKSRRSMARISV